MRKIFLIPCFFFFGGWTQTFLSYINVIPSTEFVDLTKMLEEAGLIPPLQVSNTNQNVRQIHPQGTLIAKNILTLKQHSYTLAIPANTRTNLTVPTQNYLKARPYFSSEGMIYDADSSFPLNGEFSFLIGDKPGKIIIRTYNPDSGQLQAETTFHIEIIQ